MKISVIIPFFNSEKYIQEALQSVFNQQHTFHEVICINDSSNDRTAEIIEKNFSVCMINNSENKGPSFTRNRGIQASSGTHIAFLDADDIWNKDKTRMQMQAFEEDSNLGLVGGLTEYFFMDGHGHHSSRQGLRQRHFNSYLGSFLIKRSVFDQIGMFDENMKLSEDQDWFLRAREAKVKTKILQDTVLNYRVHQNNFSKDIRFERSGFLQALKKSIDRRRDAGEGELESLDI